MGTYQSPREWGRLLTALITPFDSDNQVNYSEVKKIARYVVDVQKNDGIVVNGTTGESPTLTESEKYKLLEVVLEEVGDRAAVLFGAGTYNTAESIHLAKQGEKLGAHGIMLVNPYYNKPSQDGLYAHFSTIAREITLPVLLYNIQGRTSVNLETSTLLKLAEIDNIVAVKEASGNVPQMSEVCRLAPKGFRVYSGDDGLTLPLLSLGGHGIISVAGHVVGRYIKEMIEVFATNPAKATEIHHLLSIVYKALFMTTNPVPVKYATSILGGFDCQSVRLPLVPLTEEEKKVVELALKSIER